MQPRESSFAPKNYFAPRDKTVVFDWDGTICNTFPLLEQLYKSLDLDIGKLPDFQSKKETREKYKGVHTSLEILRNVLQRYTYLQEETDKRKKEPFLEYIKRLWHYRQNIRKKLQILYRTQGELFPEIKLLLRDLSRDKQIDIHVLSRNFLPPLYITDAIRTVLHKEGVKVDNISVHAVPHTESKAQMFSRVTEAAQSPCSCLITGDEARDYRAIEEVKFLKAKAPNLLFASHGFDSRENLEEAGVPSHRITENPAEFVDGTQTFLRS